MEKLQKIAPKKIVPKIIQYLKTDIWMIKTDYLPFAIALRIKIIKIFLIACNRLKKNQFILRASALTYYSVLSIVPVAATAFGIAQGFGLQKHLENQLLENFPGQEEIVSKIIAFSNNLLEDTKSGLMAGIGVTVLFLVVMKGLSHIESALNAIWEIKTPRTIGRRLSDYLAIMTTGPLLVIVSGSVTVFIKTQVMMMAQKVSILGIFHNQIIYALKLLPFGLIWVVFSMLYIIMPNGRVKPASGIMAGIIAGSIYQFCQWTYIYFQVGVAQYNAIYGSFAALPLFLIWLQLSWVIVLLGAAIAAAHQNVNQYEFEPHIKNISYRLQKLIALYISLLAVHLFTKGEPPLTIDAICEKAGMAKGLAKRIITCLVEGGILSGVAGKKQKGYQPAKDVNLITVKSVIDAIEKRGTRDIPVKDSENFEKLTQIMDSMEDAIKKSPANRLLKDI